jgi:hypothetical protein
LAEPSTKISEKSPDLQQLEALKHHFDVRVRLVAHGRVRHHATNCKPDAMPGAMTGQVMNGSAQGSAPRTPPLSATLNSSRAALVCSETIEAFGHSLDTERTEVRLGLATCVDEDERRLRHNLKVVPNLTGFIDDVREPADPELVDEADDLIELVAPCYSDKGDIGTVLFLDLCDRRGFTTANRSPRRPEPEHHVLTAQRVEVELSAICSRHHHRFDVRGGLSSSGSRGCHRFGDGRVIAA